jgi:hypothetical protein
MIAGDLVFIAKLYASLRVACNYVLRTVLGTRYWEARVAGSDRFGACRIADGNLFCGERIHGSGSGY